MKTTWYFDATRIRPDRLQINDKWMLRVIGHPEHQHVQADGGITTSSPGMLVKPASAVPDVSLCFNTENDKLYYR